MEGAVTRFRQAVKLAELSRGSTPSSSVDGRENKQAAGGASTAAATNGACKWGGRSLWYP